MRDLQVGVPRWSRMRDLSAPSSGTYGLPSLRPARTAWSCEAPV